MLNNQGSPLNEVSDDDYSEPGSSHHHEFDADPEVIDRAWSDVSAALRAAHGDAKLCAFDASLIELVAPLVETGKIDARAACERAVKLGRAEMLHKIARDDAVRSIAKQAILGITSFAKSAKGDGGNGDNSPAPAAPSVPTADLSKKDESRKGGKTPALKLDDAAFYGLAGDIVREIEPHTESDPAAILVQVLAYFGNVIGRSAHYEVESDRHAGNLFIALVGDTSKARKGTSGGRVRAVFENVDSGWLQRIKTGLSSWEGLINEVRDPTQKWNANERTFEEIDPGVADKRLLVIESEFAGALSVMERPGNTLSPVLRNAWDGRTLETLTKNSPLKATGAHVSVIAHITGNELRAMLSRTSAANGFGNRFCFFCVQRSKLLPFGGDLNRAAIEALGKRVAEAVAFAKTVGRVPMTPDAREVWSTIYSELSDGKPGLLGAITARAEAQCIHFALLYALLDGNGEIDVAHLHAAVAVWEYSEASAAQIFGDSLGDDVADEIYHALVQAGDAGMTRTAIRDLFGRNRNGNRIQAAFNLLHTHGRVRTEPRKTGDPGRPAEAWIAVKRGD